MKPKFTLRDLFWLVLVVAMGMGWWMDRSAVAKKAATLEMEKTEILRWWNHPHRRAEPPDPSMLQPPTEDPFQ